MIEESLNIEHKDEYVLKNHQVTNADVQKMVGVSRATAMRLLQKLDGVLEPVGHGAGGYYRIRIY
jgi:ATP-dependent DNA helicase RecG